MAFFEDLQFSSPEYAVSPIGALVSFPSRSPGTPHRRIAPIADADGRTLSGSQSFVASPSSQFCHSASSPHADYFAQSPNARDFKSRKEDLKPLLRMNQMPVECDKVLADEGIELVDDLDGYDEVALMKIGLKRLHAQRLLKAITMRRTCARPMPAPPPALPPDTYRAVEVSYMTPQKKMVRYDSSGTGLVHLTPVEQQLQSVSVYEYDDDELCMLGHSPLAKAASPQSARILFSMELSSLPSKGTPAVKSQSLRRTWGGADNSSLSVSHLSSSAAWTASDSSLVSGRLWKAYSPDYIIKANRRATSNFKFSKGSDW